MVLSAVLVPKWHCGLCQIQKEVQKCQILVLVSFGFGSNDQKFHADYENILELQF
jgi:hypothetical protein